MNNPYTQCTMCNLRTSRTSSALRHSNNPYTVYARSDHENKLGVPSPGPSPSLRITSSVDAVVLPEQPRARLGDDLVHRVGLVGAGAPVGEDEDVRLRFHGRQDLRCHLGEHAAAGFGPVTSRDVRLGVRP